MTTTRTGLGATGLLVALLAAPAADAQQEFPATLYWGSGLIDIPVAWIAPLTGDFAINYSGKRFTTDPVSQKIDYNDAINSQLTFSMSAFGRLEVGYAAFNNNVEWGFFGRGLLIDESAFRARPGIGRWLVPSIAVGVRNVGPYQHIDRFGIGYELESPAEGSADLQHIPDSLHLSLNTTNSFYGVATKGFSLAEIRPNWPDVDLSFSLGYGTGLFSDDGSPNIPNYASHDRGGLFYGFKTEFAPAPNLVLSLMAEDNSWEYNVGASLVYRGIRAGAYLTEVGSGGAPPDTLRGDTYLFNYQKFAFTVGWQSNVFALLRGEFLQSRAAALERQRQSLLAEIAARQQRIAALEIEINRFEAQNLLELEQRRVQAEAELRAEREQLQRLEDRLKRIEQQTPPPLPPPSRPPPSSPPPAQPLPASGVPPMVR